MNKNSEKKFSPGEPIWIHSVWDGPHFDLQEFVQYAGDNMAVVKDWSGEHEFPLAIMFKVDDKAGIMAVFNKSVEGIQERKDSLIETINFLQQMRSDPGLVEKARKLKPKVYQLFKWAETHMSLFY